MYWESVFKLPLHAFVIPLTLSTLTLTVNVGFLEGPKTPQDKPANETVRKLIEASFRETKRLYGERKYLFVNARDPDKPMTYKTIQYQMQKLILEQNLRDDSGAPFKVGTHTFRHTLGRRLTERHVDDKTIAQLLGHAGLSSVHRYRMFGSPALADETRDVRREKDVILLNLMNGGNLDEL